MHTAADKMGQLLDELLIWRVLAQVHPDERITFKELAQEAVGWSPDASARAARVQVADAAVFWKGPPAPD